MINPSYNDLINIQFSEFPETVILDGTKLLSYHGDQTVRNTIYSYIEKFGPNVFYYINDKSIKSDLPSMSNGIRYGIEPEAYISLPWIKINKG